MAAPKTAEEFLKRVSPSFFVATSAESLVGYLDIEQMRKTPPEQRKLVGQILARKSNRRDHDQVTRALLRIVDSGQGNPLERMISLAKGAVALSAWVSALESMETTCRQLWCSPGSECKVEGLANRVEHLVHHVAKFRDAEITNLLGPVRERIRYRNDLVHGASQEATLQKIAAVGVVEACKPLNDLRDILLHETLAKFFQIEDSQRLVLDRMMEAVGLDDSERMAVLRANGLA